MMEVRNMKKILLVALMTLFFVSCSGRGRTSSSGSTTDPNLNANTITCVDNATFSVADGKCECNSGYKFDTAGLNCIVSTTTCGAHASLSTSGVCVCDPGYKFDSQGVNCIQDGGTNKIKLNPPVLVSQGSSYSFTLPVTDVNNNPVPNGYIHTVYAKLPTGGIIADGTNCSNITYNTDIDCTNSRTLYSGQSVAVTKPGTYCVKAIACDDPEGYIPSDLLITQVIIP